MSCGVAIPRARYKIFERQIVLIGGREASMGEDDKNAQIGAAVSEFQKAKVHLGHIETRITDVFRAYREVGATMDSDQGTPSEPQLEHGRVKFGGYAANINASDILNERDLALLLAERDRARARLKEAGRVMQSLGVTDLCV